MRNYDEEENTKTIKKIIEYIQGEKSASERLKIEYNDTPMGQFLKARAEGMLDAYDHIMRIIDKL